ncbi:MAG: PDZ domain-containing protein, partial [Caulobacteraceae bacterium]
VAKGSAGAEAGVAVGDVITAIDGKPAVAEELYAARRRLRDEAVGTKVALAVRHGGETREVVLVLRDQI